MEKSLQDSIKNTLSMLTIVLILSSIFIIFQIISGFRNKEPFDTITVDSSAETFAMPDIAEISFSVIREDEDLAIAQESVQIVVEDTLASLKNIGIEDRDIKTTYYNANPRYEYGRAICLQYRCDDGERALVGYEVNQSISITIRNLDNVGTVISSLGSSDVSNIYGPNFRIENEDGLKAQVREEAITKAKEKAKDLAKSLGVRIIGIEDFSEGYSGGPYYTRTDMATMSANFEIQSSDIKATIPVGENKIQTSVTITYRVK